MAHFARVHEGVVIDRHVVHNNELTDSDGNEQESLGQTYLSALWGGDPAEYVQMSYNRPNYRGGYADIGWTWDGKKFAPPAQIDA